jgi:hypothetical protein
MIRKESNAHDGALEVMTFGRTCKRCNVYFVTKNKIEDLCPWCMRVQTGQGHEGMRENVDGLAFDDP